MLHLNKSSKKNMINRFFCKEYSDTDLHIFHSSGYLVYFCKGQTYENKIIIVMVKC